MRIDDYRGFQRLHIVGPGNLVIGINAPLNRGRGRDTERLDESLEVGGAVTRVDINRQHLGPLCLDG